MGMDEMSKPAKESQLSSEINKAQGDTNRLLSVISDLYSRLGPVRRDGHDEEKLDKASDLPDLVERADQVRDIGIKIYTATEELKKLIELIEA
jgi:hypothetical protein